MKVLHFYKTYYPDSYGGVEQVIYQIVEGVRKHDIESSILSLSNQINLTEDKVGNRYRIRSNFKIASTDFSWHALKKFKELASQADVIHYHFPWPFMDIIHFLSGIRKPTLVTYHSDIVHQKFLLKFYRPLMHYFLDSVNVIVASSPNYLQSSSSLLPFKDKVHIIPYCLNSDIRLKLNSQKKMAWKKILREKFFLFVGVHRYYKGLTYLLEANAKRDLPIVIVGEGPFTDKLKVQANQLGLKNTLFIGQISDEDKAILLDLSFAFVFPSHLRSEAFGISLIEAAMFGKPMISCEIGTGTSFINLNGKTGIVVPPADVDALSLALDNLWDNPEKAKEMGNNAKDRFEELFQADAMCHAYANLYKNLLQKKLS